MPSIYAISQDLIEVFSAIEENEGELTPELEEKLNISQEEFKDKVQGYVNYIKHIDDDIAAIKAEKCRLDELKTRKEKEKEKLSNILIGAIEKFGDTNKSGKKFVDYGTGKVSIRNTKAIDVNEDRISVIEGKFKEYIEYLDHYNQIDTLDNLDAETYNNTVMFGCPEEEHITDSDMSSIKLDINIKLPLSELKHYNKCQIISAIVKNLDGYKISTSVDKIKVKECIGNGTMVTVAQPIINKSLSIK